MKYRPEIDGLRAVAVLPVVLFHSGVAWVAGGFVGVDIFFVISGYLITALLLDDIDAGRFSIVGFYERRLRRIFPALFVVTALTGIVAVLVMLPSELREFGKSVIGVALFVSNFVFYREAGYFQPAAETFPLLHTWSLAVEEQFYLVMPLLLAGLTVLGPRWRAGVLVALLLASLVAAEVTLARDPDLAFFSITTRAWELLAGSLCALWLRRTPVRPSGSLAALGLAMILGAVVLFNEATPFPSLWALVPVAGTALVILFAGAPTLVARVLTLRGVVALGLISYSVYLWHQPLLAFVRLTAEREPPPALMLAAGLAALPLGWLSWRFVEQPFRRGPLARRLRRREIFSMTGLGTAVLLAGAVVLYATDGLPGRSTPDGRTWAQHNLEARVAVNPGLHVACRRGFTLDDRCASGPAPSVLLWGDSHAMHLGGALRDALPEGVAFRQITLPSCGPVPGATLLSSSTETAACAAFNRQVIDWLATGPGIETVILSSPMAWLATPSLTLRLADGREVPGSLQTGQALLADAVTRLQEMGLRVVVLSPPPNPGWNIGHCLVRRTLRDLSLDGCNFSAEALSPPTRLAYSLLAALDGVAPVIFLDRVTCSGGTCLAADNGVFLYRDRGHLSIEGSAWLGQNLEFQRALRAALAQPLPAETNLETLTP